MIKNNSNKTEVLINRDFMKLAGLTIDPNVKFLLSIENPDDEQGSKFA